MENLKFSILIPVYNVEKYLSDCLDSVLNQSYQNFEIILVNDGSLDSSGEICDKYAKNDGRIQVIHQENKGLLSTRRHALDYATGDYYLFLDSDDFWENNLLSVLYENIETFKSEIVIFKYKKVDEKGEFISDTPAMFKHKTTFLNEDKKIIFEKIISSSNLNNLVCKAIKITLHDNTNYEKYKDIKNAEDLLQTLPLIYKANKILYLDNSLYNYREVKTSMTQSFNKNLFNDITVVRTVLLNYLTEIGLNKKENKENFYMFYMDSINNYILRLITSEILSTEKKLILLNIRNEKLYINGLEYNKRFNMSLHKKLITFLMRKRQYFLLLQLGKLIPIKKTKT